MFGSIFSPATQSKAAAPQSTVSEFVKEYPSATYTFDSKRDAPEAELCRHVDNGKPRCIKVAMASKALFQRMQDLGFYCALPFDPAKTHMECTPIPK